MRHFLSLIFCSFGLWSCVKDEPQPQVPIPVTPTATLNRVLMTAEGNYGSGNAGLYTWDQSSEQSSGDVYMAANGSHCGDVLQSLLTFNKKYFLVINNSGKVIVTDQNFVKTAEIKGFASPRYLVQVTESKAYLSDLHADKISIINLRDLTVKGSIPCKGWTERMLVMYNKVFVTNLYSRFVYVINSSTDAVVDSISVGWGASSLIADADDKVWLLCRGDKALQEKAKLVQIDPASHMVLKSIDLEGSPFNLCVAGNGRDLYFLNDGLYHFSISGTSPDKIYGEANANFYGLGIDPVTDNIYVSDAKDYAQASVISVLTKDGTRKKSIKAGINTSGFYFD